MKAKQASTAKRSGIAHALRAKTAPAVMKKSTPKAASKVAKASVAAKQTKSDAAADSPGKKFLQSSLGAITRSRDDATEAVAEGLGRFAESIGLHKLEDVFDQRVASALARIGIPTAKELARLRDQVEQLSRQVDVLKSRQRK